MRRTDLTRLHDDPCALPWAACPFLDRSRTRHDLVHRRLPRQDGRVAVVTGANGGLGLASATALAGAGAHVVMAARNQDKARRAHDDVVAAHPEASVEVVALDLGSLASVATAAAQILDAHERIDLLMCNAGVMATPQGTTDSERETGLRVNVATALAEADWRPGTGLGCHVAPDTRTP